MENIINAFRENKYIKEKQFGNISSFNFTKSAFHNKIWDEQTMKARGLFINTSKNKVIARAYDKFFNINERPETTLKALRYKFIFPITAYVKENGFLGIVSYNEEGNSLFITTKSTPCGDYAEWFKDILYKALSDTTLENMKNYSKEHNVSFVFECVDMINDPHIIEYNQNQLFLLDIVYNNISYQKYDFQELCETAEYFGLPHKEKAFEIKSWKEFLEWYHIIENEEFKYDDRYIEGFVIEDSCGYMVKVKLFYYNFWKKMRSITQDVFKKGATSEKRESSLDNPLAIQYYNYIKSLKEKQDNVPKDICSLRKMFYSSNHFTLK